jgi:hypothetical protein
MQLTHKKKNKGAFSWNMQKRIVHSKTEFAKKSRFQPIMAGSSRSPNPNNWNTHIKKLNEIC